MKHILPSLSLAALTLTLLSGCATGGASVPKNSTKYDLENQTNFVLLDSGTQRSVTASRISERTTDDGRLEVLVNIRNRENRRIEVQANCVFKDASGFSTGDETPFQNAILTENAQETLKFTAMNNLAKKYTIRVRQSR